MLGLSPIQIQLLIFIAYHDQTLCNVSHLAREFNVTKPTISDAVRVLYKKELIAKDFSSEDNRSFTIQLTTSGREIVSETEDFAYPLKRQLQQFNPAELENLFSVISGLIYQLNLSGVLTVQRTCYGCRFFDGNRATAYCNLLQKDLQRTDIRLDCPEFEQKV